MTTLVTGATGFLGRHLVGLLAERGERIRVLVRPGAVTSPFAELDAQIVEGDVNDNDTVRAAAVDCGLVYHLAGVVSHDRRHLERMRAVNVEGTRRMLAAVEPGARVVHVSSVAAIGPASSHDRPANEQQEFPAVAAHLPYARTKHEAELVALEAAHRGCDVVIANPGFLLGPGDVHRVSTWPISAYLAGKLRFTTTGGLSFVDARDVARGLIALADGGRAGERTILAAETGNLSWQDFFAKVASVSGVRRRTVRLPAAIAVAGAAISFSVKPDEVRAASHWWFYTGAKAECELRFAARPLAETIADTINDHYSASRPLSSTR